MRELTVRGVLDGARRAVSMQSPAAQGVPGRRVTAWPRVLARTVGSALVTLWGVVSLTFVMVRLIGNPVDFLAGQFRSGQTVSAIRNELGLNRPVWIQYVSYLNGLVHGNLGRSAISGQLVLPQMLARLPSTLELLAVGILGAGLVTLILAIPSSRRPNGIADRVSDVIITAGASFPAFWVGLVLIFVFYAKLGWAPPPIGEINSSLSPPTNITGSILVDSVLRGDLADFTSALAYIALPSITLTIMLVPTVLQTTRAVLLEVYESDYIRMAKACGLGRRTVERYALKNIIVPFANVLAITVGSGLSGAVLVEVVFSWPGIGDYVVQAMDAADYTPVMGVVLLCAVIYILAYGLADLIAVRVDPRIAERA
jgi:ABC-type dipeptide/oligopeptide/nickel transport system permease component